MAGSNWPTWVGRTWRRTFVTAGVALIVAFAGAAWSQYLVDVGERRVRDGRPVQALVTDVHATRWGKLGSESIQASVTYEVDGRRYDAGLSGYDGLVKGDVVTLYVDPHHPADGATAHGLLTEGALVLVPDFMTWVGCIIAALAAAGRVVELIRARGRSQSSVA